MVYLEISIASIWRLIILSLSSLKETYEALRTFKVLGIGHQFDIKAKSCKSVVDTVGSPSSTLKDLFQALEVNGILKCELSKETFAVCLSLLLI